MSSCHHQARQVVCPTKVIYRDICVPEPVDVIQPIEIVNRFHPVPVPRYRTTYSERNEFVSPTNVSPTGPTALGPAGHGPECRR